MKTNPLKDGVISENSGGVGTATSEMVRARAAELAVIDGLLSSAATKSHFAQAKRELTGEPDMDPKDAILESAPESERWDPVPGSTGHKARVAPSEDEDEEEEVPEDASELGEDEDDMAEVIENVDEDED